MYVCVRAAAAAVGSRQQSAHHRTTDTTYFQYIGHAEFESEWKEFISDF